MTDLTARIAREHQRVYNRPHATCLCGWDRTYTGDQQPYLRHVAEVTERAVRELALIELEQAWRSGYYTGKRDYAASVTGGMSISTPNPYTERIARGGTDEEVA